MQNLFDKQIHVDEFKLRLLLTNGCNYNCLFCLNDFQNKPEGDPEFLSTVIANDAIFAYSFCANGYPLQVYFSGGEPTLHPHLPDLISFAKNQKCRVTLNTNGSFSDELEERLSSVDCMHFGVYKKDLKLAQRIKRMKGNVQCVYSKNYPYVDFDFLKYYLNFGLEVKIFGDLHEDPKYYEKFATEVVKEFPNAPLSFRFIGIQENRGIGCHNCDRYCVTLKGAWVFPNGNVSHCPQKCQGIIYSPKNIMEWKDAMKGIEKSHRRDGT